jgi:hypothetical protein
MLSRYGPKLNKAVLLRERASCDESLYYLITKSKRRQCTKESQFPSCVVTASKKKFIFNQPGHVIGREMYLASGCDRTRRSTASIKRIFTFVMLGSVGSGKDTRPNVSPGAVIEGFLLCIPTRQSKRCENAAHGRTWHQRISALGYISR